MKRARIYDCVILLLQYRVLRELGERRLIDWLTTPDYLAAYLKPFRPPPFLPQGCFLQDLNSKHNQDVTVGLLTPAKNVLTYYQQATSGWRRMLLINVAREMSVHIFNIRRPIDSLN